jgi:hypothetical protein
MELAGLACAQALATVYDKNDFRKVLVCCGPGNQEITFALVVFIKLMIACRVVMVWRQLDTLVSLLLIRQPIH